MVWQDFGKTWITRSMLGKKLVKILVCSPKHMEKALFFFLPSTLRVLYWTYSWKVLVNRLPLPWSSMIMVALVRSYQDLANILVSIFMFLVKSIVICSTRYVYVHVWCSIDYHVDPRSRQLMEEDISTNVPLSINGHRCIWVHENRVHSINDKDSFERSLTFGRYFVDSRSGETGNSIWHSSDDDIRCPSSWGGTTCSTCHRIPAAFAPQGRETVPFFHLRFGFCIGRILGRYQWIDYQQVTKKIDAK